jgi:integrase/recombinase XerC
LRTLSAPQTPRPESEKLIKLKIIQRQVGHEADSSTAVYTHVSSDFMNTALRRALAPALEGNEPAGRGC